MTDAIHYFDLFTYLLGQAPIAVTATLRDYLGRGMDDCSFATVEYGRIPAFVEAGYFAPGTYRDCVIVGERATLAADFGSSEVRVHANQHVKGAGGWQAPEGAVEAFKASGKEPLSHELELFLDAVTHRTAPAVDVEAGLLALRVVEAAQRSSALGPPCHPLRDRLARAMIRAHQLRWRPRQPAQRTESTPRRLPSGAASQLNPAHPSSWVCPTAC